MKQNQETGKLTQHEDVALKVMSDFFREEILPALQIEGKVVGSIADEIIQNLKSRTDAGLPLTKADLLPLVLSPLMGGTMSQKDRITAAYDITRHAQGIDKGIVRKVEAVIYVMADKFLETAEMKQLKEELKLTKLGQILYEEWRAEGIATGRIAGERSHLLSQIQRKISKGKAPETIAEEVEESIETVIAFIREISNGGQEDI